MGEFERKLVWSERGGWRSAEEKKRIQKGKEHSVEIDNGGGGEGGGGTPLIKI